MRCCIADLIVEVPEAGGMVPRCQDYLYNGSAKADIIIREDDYTLSDWSGVDYDTACYLESGYHFYGHLLRFGGMMLHASAVEYRGRAYLFSGPCGVGKSTHTRLWQQVFGSAAQVFNDDKPALRFLDNRWYAYGTPWCGKDSININRKVPLGGICFLQQGLVNRIHRLPASEAVPLVFGQTYYRLRKVENIDRLVAAVDALLQNIPAYRLENRPTPDAVHLSYQTMCEGAESFGL